MLSDLSRFPIPEPLLPGGWSAARYATGINDLDARITRLGKGELWIFTSAPGQGRSTLLTQIATHLATQHRVPTWFVSSRDPAHIVSARAHSAVGRVPLGDFQNDRIEHSRSRVEAARETLQTAPMRVVAHRHAASSVCDDPQLHKLAEPTTLFFYDPDIEPGWDLVQAHRLAQAGDIVVVTLPREQVLPGNAYHCDVEPAMRLAESTLDGPVVMLLSPHWRSWPRPKPPSTTCAPCCQLPRIALTPVLVKIDFRWSWTVCSERCMAAEISLVSRPALRCPSSSADVPILCGQLVSRGDAYRFQATLYRARR